MKAKSCLLWLYGSNRRLLRSLAVWVARKSEGGEFRSPTLRAIMKQYHGVTIGLYTHGGCFVPFSFGRDVEIGRYCSVALSARVITRNHPMEFPSTHAFFFNPKLRIVDFDRVERTPLRIGSDVWLGHNCIVMPAVREIGHGAVVAAGAVVAKDVPPYAVVVGNPARVVRYRFSQDQIRMLLASRWWERPLEELPVSAMNQPLNDAFLEELLGRLPEPAPCTTVPESDDYLIGG